MPRGVQKGMIIVSLLRLLIDTIIRTLPRVKDLVENCNIVVHQGNPQLDASLYTPEQSLRQDREIYRLIYEICAKGPNVRPCWMLEFDHTRIILGVDDATNNTEARCLRSRY